MTKGGLIEHWKNEFFITTFGKTSDEIHKTIEYHLDLDHMNSNNNTFKSLKLNQLINIFYLLFIGYLNSIFYLFIELLYLYFK